MAHTTLDLSPRTTRRSDDDQNRAATFRRADVPGETASGDLGSTGRRAAYRPREEVAIRRDVVEHFRNRLERDATHTPDNPEAVADALFGIARAEEALGRFEEAHLALKRLRNVRDFSPVVWALSRRLHRQEGREGLAIDTLQKARKSAEGPLAVLLDLELARHAWLDGESADGIISRVDSLADAGGDYASLWKTRLHLDALLERGANEWALGVLGRELEQIDDPELRDVLRMRAAIWSAVWGELEEATGLLEEVRGNDNLDGDLGQFLSSLYFELGERAKANALFETFESMEHTDAMSAAMLQETVSASPKGADDVLESMIRREPEDWTALRARETHLERYIDREGSVEKAGESLIDVLNLQLEGPLSTQERVTKLTRLGRLYECEAGLEEAAAEVYREALGLEPDHVPALRALGRLYARRDNWAGLADLYEREIANMAGAPSVWRRHFQLAEIYRVRLENAVRALEHYRLSLIHI